MASDLEREFVAHSIPEAAAAMLASLLTLTGIRGVYFYVTCYDAEGADGCRVTVTMVESEEA